MVTEKRYAAYTEALGQKKEDGTLRTIPESGVGAGLTDLTSNDYMGMAVDSDSLPYCWEGIPEKLKQEFEQICGADGNRIAQLLNEPGMWSASASRLLSIRQQIPVLLEKTLEADYGKPALLFNSGYHANTGAIGALNLPGTVFLTDRLMHASAYDGLRACGALMERFPHNDTRKLRKLIEKHADKSRIIIVTESVFSMDGDCAPLKELTDLREEFDNVLLYVDEAHAYGCYGKHGLGMAEETGLTDKIDLLVGTFGKAGGSAGAFIVAPEPLRSQLINSARSFIFSTALPPAVILRSLQNHLRLRGARERRDQLAENSRKLRELITEKYGPTPSTTQIIPIPAGNAEKAIEIARGLRERGIMALPIRRPTVPPGTERVRISVSSVVRIQDIGDRI